MIGLNRNGDRSAVEPASPIRFLKPYLDVNFFKIILNEILLTIIILKLLLFIFSNKDVNVYIFFIYTKKNIFVKKIMILLRY